MNGYLLATNIIGEARIGVKADSGLRAWIETVEDDELFLSVLVTGEIRKGIELARNRDFTHAQSLERWLAGLERNLSERILPVTPAIADQWGGLSAIRPVSTADGLLAASALIHDLTLVTRNTGDVAHTQAKLLNPFKRAS